MNLEDIRKRYHQVRQHSLALVEPLETEDFCLQSMPEASPVKWHLAHTTWFFETFVLRPFADRYQPFHQQFEQLFNSYYNSVGQPFPRPRRHLQSRPTVGVVLRYREVVDMAMEAFLAKGANDEALSRIELGTHHEQQHQELLLTDLQHAWWFNPMRPDTPMVQDNPSVTRELGWIAVAGGLHAFGHSGSGFAFDNEGPAHQHWLEDFEVADRLISNGEYMAFMEDGGYRQPLLWLSDGWDAVRQHGWNAPLYWYQKDGIWWQWSLTGDRPVDPARPVTHVSYYEADAFARWAGARLPTEFEWEQAARQMRGTGDKPGPDTGDFFGQAWQWTASPYVPYPGFQPSADAIGEYNGKFMCDQWVLRGSSLLTPPDHTRITYRNFFQAAARWQRTGIRLARGGQPQIKDIS